MPDSLRINDNMMLLPTLAVINNIINQNLLVIIILFRQKNILRTICNAAPQSDIAGIPSHHFDNTAPLMRGRCIPDLVDRIHRRIHSRIKTNRIIRAGNIQVYRTGNTNRINPPGSQLLRPFKRAVSSDHYQTVNAMLPANLRALVLSFFRTELGTPRRIKDRAAFGNRIGNTASVQLFDLLI